ncbi:MAG: DUF177 domain-containing protein [Flavobacteriales bacterium]|nr:DUF177 domain-containing protein [Flavobacteriales bacterium]
MKYLKQFITPISGLPEGEHWFDFEIRKEFFECFENSDILDANIVLKLQLIKRSTMLELEFSFAGTVNVECDRCISPVDIPIELTEKIIAKFGNDAYDEAAEVLVIPFNEPEFDVSKLVYELIFLGLPMKRVHNEGECLEGIEDRISSTEDNSDDEIDPRWAQLKNL